jgi:hypothetical protein
MKTKRARLLQSSSKAELLYAECYNLFGKQECVYHFFVMSPIY